jgi:hypothetical protein
MGMAADAVRDRQPHRCTVVADLDLGEVKRVEDQLPTAPDQRRVNLVGVSVQGHRGGLGHAAAFLPQKRLGQRCQGW